MPAMWPDWWSAVYWPPENGSNENWREEILGWKSFLGQASPASPDEYFEPIFEYASFDGKMRAQIWYYEELEPRFYHAHEGSLK